MSITLTRILNLLPATPALVVAALTSLAAPVWGGSAAPALPAAAPAAGRVDPFTGTLEVVQECYLQEQQGARSYELVEDRTGERHPLRFAVEPPPGHLT